MTHNSAREFPPRTINYAVDASVAVMERLAVLPASQLSSNSSTRVAMMPQRQSFWRLSRSAFFRLTCFATVLAEGDAGPEGTPSRSNSSDAIGVVRLSRGSRFTAQRIEV